MKVSKKFVLRILAGVFALLLLVSAVYQYSRAEHYKASLAAMQPTTEQTPSEMTSSFPQATTQYQLTEELPATDTKATQEEVIRNTVISFIEAKEEFCSYKNPEQYNTSFEGLITQNGMQNMADYITRYPALYDEDVLEMGAEKVKVYIQTKNETDVTAFCFVYVAITLTPKDQEGLVSYVPKMIQVELKKESDGVFRVNYISFEQQIGTFNLPLAEIFW